MSAPALNGVVPADPGEMFTAMWWTAGVYTQERIVAWRVAGPTAWPVSIGLTEPMFIKRPNGSVTNQTTGENWLTEGDWLAAMQKLPPDEGPPLPVSAYINEQSDVVLVFSRELDPAKIPARSAFSVVSDGNTLNIVAIFVAGSTVRVQIGASGAEVTVSYTKPSTNFLQSLSDQIAVATFTNFPVG